MAGPPCNLVIQLDDTPAICQLPGKFVMGRCKLRSNRRPGLPPGLRPRARGQTLRLRPRRPLACRFSAAMAPTRAGRSRRGRRSTGPGRAGAARVGPFQPARGGGGASPPPGSPRARPHGRGWSRPGLGSRPAPLTACKRRWARRRPRTRTAKGRQWSPSAPDARAEGSLGGPPGGLLGVGRVDRRSATKRMRWDRLRRPDKGSP